MKTCVYKLNFDVEDENPNPESPEAKTQLEKIFKEMTDNVQIESFTFTSSWLTSKQLYELANILSKHTNLKVLNLSYNCLDAHSIAILKKIIQEHPQIKFIYLSGNKFDDKAIHELIKDISPDFKSRLMKIEKVDFSNNYLTLEGIRLIRENFSSTSALTALTGNKLTQIEIEKEKKELELFKKANAEKIAPAISYQPPKNK